MAAEAAIHLENRSKLELDVDGRLRGRDVNEGSYC